MVRFYVAGTLRETNRTDTCELSVERPSSNRRAAYRRKAGLIARPVRAIACCMTKLIALFMAALALIQYIKPLGLPGLKRRQDAWKLAVGGMVVMFVFILITAGFK